jgi:hypothetical protein
MAPSNAITPQPDAVTALQSDSSMWERNNALRAGVRHSPEERDKEITEATKATARGIDQAQDMRAEAGED